MRATRFDDWVQTNQLVRLALEIGWTNRYLVMEDRDGRKLRVHLAALRGNRRVFEAFLSGVGHAAPPASPSTRQPRWSSGAT